MVLFVWGLFGSQKILNPVRQELDLSPKDEGVESETFSVTTRDGVKIVGWLMLDPRPRGVVVGCHGYGASKADILGVTRFIRQNGYSLVLFDFRRHGESGGRTSTLGKNEILDLEAVLEWVRQEPRLQDDPLVLYGFSMGAAVAIRTAALHPDVRLVVSDNTYVYLDRTIRRHHKLMYPFIPTTGFVDAGLFITSLRMGAWVQSLSPAEAMGRLNRPVYMIHSSGDATITVNEVRDLFKCAQEPRQLWIADTADHMGASGIQAEYESRILAFLDEHLGS